MFTREGVQYFLTEFNLTADKAVDYLTKRQVELESEYREDIVKGLDVYLQKEEKVEDIASFQTKKTNAEKSDNTFIPSILDLKERVFNSRETGFQTQRNTNPPN